MSDTSQVFEVDDTYTSFEGITAFEQRGLEETKRLFFPQLRVQFS
jgi:hypothetical protein